MRKTKKVKKIETVIQTVDVLCNNCGNSCSNSKRYNNAKTTQDGYSGLEEVEVHGGYDSKFIGDMISWRFSICEECLSKIVNNFKIPHEVKGDWSSEYVSLPDYNKLEKEGQKKNKQEFIDAIQRLTKELGRKSSKKELESKNISELYNELQVLNKQKREQ